MDNASEDGSADAIAREFPQVRLVRSERNLGFAAANNLAAAGSSKLKAQSSNEEGEAAWKGRPTEYLLLLNPDTVVLDGAIDKLVAFAEANPEAGIWGGRTVFADGSLNPASCWGRQTLWSVICATTGLRAVLPRSGLFNPEGYGGWARDSAREVDIVSGCFLLIRRDLWERLGGLDPAFFMYGEEADLCLRARALGARPRVTPDAVIVHYGGASERIRADKLVRVLGAKMLLIRRHWRRRPARLGLCCLTVLPLTRAVAYSILGCLPVRTGGRARAAAAEWWAVWSGRDQLLAASVSQGPCRDARRD